MTAKTAAGGCHCGAAETKAAASAPDLPVIQDEDELADLAELFKVFGDSTRIRILVALIERGHCVCELADGLGLTQSAVSHQLRILKQARLVRSRRSGRSVRYVLADDHVRTIIDQGRNHIGE